MNYIKEYFEKRTLKKLDRLFYNMASDANLIEYYRIRESYGKWS